ncbi:SCO family protein [Limibaculum sp. FT325]|uniref:SCO family protein n=1 Tax=Thermohalobaculum sediminis TaxID=2939436 RepID=UPI0020C09EF5|nr:SCO family protein [Limibaculum sediminis]MCL5776627.1 SCO family protein [Limibaculum sediminis]
MTPRRAVAAALVALATSGGAAAHDGRSHDAPAPHAANDAAPPPFPVEIRMRFDLSDQAGRRVSEAEFAGRPVALFFGYANCEAICSVALPAMAEALDLLGDDGAAIAPVMITVDPSRDTPEALARALPRYHDRLIGLTGTAEALAEARAAFQVEAAEVARDAAGAPIFAHGSFIYLVGPDGRVRSVLPPIVGPARIAELMRRHLLAL